MLSRGSDFNGLVLIESWFEYVLNFERVNLLPALRFKSWRELYSRLSVNDRFVRPPKAEPSLTDIVVGERSLLEFSAAIQTCIVSFTVDFIRGLTVSGSTWTDQ